MYLGKERAHRVLSDAEREQFVRDGVVKLENTFRQRSRPRRARFSGARLAAILKIERPGLVRPFDSENLHRNRFAKR
jgi:hypothetical protein